MVDLQNATLSGGVAVGAVANLMIQPYGAFIAGSITGAISALGYRVLQVSLSLTLPASVYDVASFFSPTCTTRSRCTTLAACTTSMACRAL